MVKVIQDKNKCIGCGACVAVCPDWEMGKDGKAEPKGAIKIGNNLLVLEVKSVGCHKAAADTCPVQCIVVKEK